MTHVTEQDIQAVRGTLDRHGFGFHFAVARECERLRRLKRSNWWTDATEFPVELHGTEIHIDLVLRIQNAVIVVECKRVNPAMSTWCFARSTAAERDPSEAKRVALEQVSWDPSAGRAFVTRREADQTEHQYHVAVEVKSGRPGDAQGGGGRSALNDALTQAVRGASGLIHAVAEKPQLLGNAARLTILPAVITTARLLTCDTDLSDASLSVGELPPEISVTERPWLWYRQHASENLRQTRAQRRDFSEDTPNGATYRNRFGNIAANDYARSVAVVSAIGLEEFLTSVSTYHVGSGLV